MELQVRRVGVQSCFVALPQPLLEVLLAGSKFPSFPIVLELQRWSNISTSATCFVAWDGAGSASPDIEISEVLAECVHLPDHSRVRVRARADVAQAKTVIVEPVTEDDWEILELNGEFIENNILAKVGVLQEGQLFPVWVKGLVVLILRVTATIPKGLVRLVPGAELLVAPKKRQNMLAANGNLTNEENPGKQEIEFVSTDAWLRVQELDPSLVQPLKFGSISCCTMPTTSIFISPDTAKAAAFADGQIVFLSSLCQDVGSQNAGKALSKKSSQKFDWQGGRSSFPADGHTDEMQHRHAIVQLIYNHGVAAGHVMIAFPLRLFIKAAIHQSVHVKTSCGNKMHTLAAGEVCPVLFKIGEYDDAPSSEKGDGLESLSTLLQSLDHSGVETESIASGSGKWQGHEDVLMAAGLLKQEDREGEETDRDWQYSVLLKCWWDAQMKVPCLPTCDKRVLPMAEEAIVHIRIGLLPQKKKLEHRWPSQSFRQTSLMPNVFVIRGHYKQKGPRDALFRLSAHHSTGAHNVQLGKSGAGYIIHKELFSGIRSSNPDKCNSFSSQVKEGRPSSLSSIGGLYSEVLDGPPLSSLSWLETPALEALSRLKLLLSYKLCNNLKTLHTPFPGSVLLHGPPASGKTKLAFALARELQDDPDVLAHGIFVQCAELVGEQADTIRTMLQNTVSEAVQHAPSVIIFDDLDLLLPFESDGPEPAIAVLSIAEYLADLMDVCQNLRQNDSTPTAVAFLAVVRGPSMLPSRLCCAGRFDFIVQLVSPAATARAGIFSQSVIRHGLSCSKSVAEKAAASCDGADVTDMELLVDRAVHAAACRFLSSFTGNIPSFSVSGDEDSITVMDRWKMQQAIPLMQRQKFEVLDKDFSAALKDFVPVAMRGISKAGGKTLHKGWEDIGGLSETRLTLEEMLEMPVKYRNIFGTAPLRLRTGVLLYGPPGCGKTHIVGAAAAACSLRLISVKGPELLNKYIGASEQGVRDVFARAVSSAPCILFFDEFDAIAPKRGHDNTGVTDRVVNQLLTELDGVEALNGVFVFAATSRPDLLDAALLRPGRLDRLLFCDFPSSKDDRYEILQVLSRKLPFAEDVDLEEVASLTEGFSGADLQAILSDAQLESVHAFLDKKQNENTTCSGQVESKPVIAMAQLRSSVRNARPSVPESEKKRLSAIYNAFLGAKTSVSKTQQSAGKRATLA